MPRRSRSFLLLLVFLTAVAATASAGPITLHNTGSADPGAVDPFYTLISPEGPAYVMVTDGFPIPPYLGTGTDSRWIEPVSGTTDNHPDGTYTYRTTFSLAGLDPATAIINGYWMSDNAGLDILINGRSTGITNPASSTTDSSTFTHWSPFVIDSGFQGGINTLDFVVVNFAQATGNPTALRVEMTGTAQAVPEPASLLLLGVGLVGIAAMARRKRA